MAIDLTNPIVVDFETYYGDDWSLSDKNMTTERYIRGDKFECIGLAIKDDEKPTQFFPRESWVGLLKQLLEANPDRVVVSHNATFDMGILGLRYNIHPKYMADTVAMATVTGLSRVASGASLHKLTKQLISMGYSVPPKGTFVKDMKNVHADDMTDEEWYHYGNYCKNDVDITHILYHLMLPDTPVDEIRMIGESTKMFADPIIELDKDCLNDYARRLETARVDNLQNIADKYDLGSIAATEKALRSPTKFVPLLEACGVEVPTKVSPKTGKVVPALAKKDQAFIDLQHHHNPNVRQLVEAKLGAGNTLDIPRCQSFLDIASRGNMPVPLYYAAAHTGRYGGSDGINLQNLPKRKGDTSLRRSMIAPKGYAIIATDSSQVEARLLAYAANEQYLVDIFISRRCPYSDMAAKVYGKTYEEIYHDAKIEPTKEGKTRRNVGKAIVLGCGYGMGVKRFRSEMKLEGLDDAVEMADMIIDTYRKTNPNIKRLWSQGQLAIEHMINGSKFSFGGPNNDLFVADGSREFFGEVIPSIKLPNGTYIYYQNIRKQKAEPNEYGFEWEYVYERPNKQGKLGTYRVYGGMLIENLIQSLAFGVLKWQALRIVDHGIPVKLNVHDEWISVVPADKLKEAAIIHAKCMREVPDYIPKGLLDCEVDVGKNYADTQTIEGL